MRLSKSLFVLCAIAWLKPGCYRDTPSSLPLEPPTWEQFKFELQCAEALGYGRHYTADDEKCKRHCFSIILEARHSADCMFDADCESISSWPPVGPCCLATSRRWKQLSFYKLSDALIDSCGIVDKICKERCEARCIQGTCRIVPDRPMVLPPGVTCSPQMVQAYFSDAGIRLQEEATTVTPGDAGPVGSSDAGSLDAGLPDAGPPEFTPRAPVPPRAAPADGGQPD
jgi:hypothetical protein